MDAVLASMAPCKGQGMRSVLPLAMGLAQCGDTSALELGSGGAHGQGLPPPWLLPAL